MSKPEAGWPVLALIRSPYNSSMHWCVAQWVGQEELEYHGDDMDFGYYDECADMCYCPEGWYEQRITDPDYELFLIDWEVVHFQELPVKPEAKS